jgi:alpha-mannosidase
VHWAANGITAKSLDTVQAHVNTHVPAGSVPVMVINPLGWERSGIAEANVQMPSAVTGDISLVDAKGSVLPSQVVESDKKTNTYHLLFRAQDVPSLGYEVLHAAPGKRAAVSDLKASGLTIENAALRITVDPQTGCIRSLYDKKASYETLAAGACGNELQAFKDTPKEYDAWNIDPGTLDVAPTLVDKVDSVTLTEHGPLRATIRVTRTWQSSKFVQDITLYTGADHAVVTNDFDWRERHILLKAAFPLAASGPFATYEIPYGTIERPTTRNNSVEKAMFEVPAMRWADLGDGQHGMSLINESKYAYDAVGNVLRLSLLRAPTWPDPEADQGRQRFSYALYPHTGDWKQALSVRHGYDFNYRLKAMQVESHTGDLPERHSFAGIAETNVVLTAMKRSEDGKGLVLRFYESAGKGGDVTLNVPAGATSATVVNLMEKPEGSSLSVAGGKVTVPVTPYQIQTVRVDYSPATEH